MKKEILRKVMKRAHQIARKLVGDWAARIKMALKIAWKELKSQRGSVGRPLPELKGTPKQVAWANDIRKKFLEEIEKATPRRQFEDVWEVAKESAYEFVVKQEDAKFFIDNREGVGYAIYNNYGEFKAIVKEKKQQGKIKKTAGVQNAIKDTFGVMALIQMYGLPQE